MIEIIEHRVLKSTEKNIKKYDCYKDKAEKNTSLKERYKELTKDNKPIKVNFRNFELGKDNEILVYMQNNFFKKEEEVTNTYVENLFKMDIVREDLAFFICINDTPAGFGQVIYTGGSYMIGNVGILESYRGFGLGKVLLSYLVKESIKCGVRRLYLKVSITNRKSIKLYKSLGFKFKKIAIEKA